jgi:plasmid replication initiation protein
MPTHDKVRGVYCKECNLRASLMASMRYEILSFIVVGTRARDHQSLKAAPDRLQSTTIATTLPQS